MEKLSLAQWKKKLDKYLWNEFMVTSDDCTDDEEMRMAHSQNETPEEFAEYKMEKYDVPRVEQHYAAKA